MKKEAKGVGEFSNSVKWCLYFGSKIDIFEKFWGSFGMCI